MESLIIIVAVIFSFAVSLGVGSSTLAIANFFVAIADGKIDPVERRLMGVVYIVLRVAMVLLLITLAILTVYKTYQLGELAWSTLLFAYWTILGVLYLNAVLMAIRVMPSKFGPSLQAGSWYTLGLISALASLGLVTFTYGQFLFLYLTILFVATLLVNGLMLWLKKRQVNPSHPNQ